MNQSDPCTALPPVYLDHVVIMLDDEAHREILSSPFLGQELGRFKIKTTTSSLAQTYTAAGLAGESTVLEFFHVEAPPLPDVTGAIVLSFPLPGSMETAWNRIDEHLEGEVHRELVQRTPAEGQDPVPWYHLLQPSFGEQSPFLLMVAEAVPEYFESLGARRGEQGEMHRSSYLTAAMGEEHRPDYYLREITEVTVNLCRGRAEILGRSLQAMGFERSGNSDEPSFQGLDVVIRVTSEDAREGIREVRAALQRSPSRPLVHRFGATSQLDLATGGTALWRFTPPPQAATRKLEPPTDP